MGLTYKIHVMLVNHRRMERPVHIWVYMDIFHHFVWYAFVVVILTISVGYSIIIYLRKNACLASEEYNKVNIVNVITSSALFPLSVMLGSGDVTNSLSSRIIFFSIGLLSCIIWSHYSSDLMARDRIYHRTVRKDDVIDNEKTIKP